jgi:TonB family protein
MRKRRHERGWSVLLAASLASLLMHLVILGPIRSLLATWFTPQAKAPPVRVVRLGSEAWASNRVVRQRAPGIRPSSPNLVRPPQERPKPVPPPPRPKPEDKLTGQVVEVAPSKDNAPNPQSRFLASQNSSVQKETVARLDQRDPSLKRVTERLQREEVAPATKTAPRVPGLSATGAQKLEKKARKGKPGVAPGAKEFVLKVPELQHRDGVDLHLSEENGNGPKVSERKPKKDVKGNADELQLELGSLGSDSDGADGDQGEKQAKLPSMSDLTPTLGTVARISGSPSRDYVEGIEEGDGTFLNTREFKYATFFYRVRDSVASYWENLAAQEYRRRDPTGSIYGGKDRSTLLTIELDPQGHLTQVRVREASGVDFLDEVAMQAFRMAEPFPNPPPGIVGADGSIRFNFQFVVTMQSRSPLNLFKYR